MFSWFPIIYKVGILCAIEVCMKQDITQHSDNELSLIVMNDESLYNMRRRSDLLEILKEYFIFTDEQAEVLRQDIEDDLKG